MRSAAREDNAYVLHVRRYRENSLLVEALTASYGRLGLVARAAARSRRPPAESVQPFREVVLLFHGREDIQTLQRAEPLGPVPLLQGDRLISGLYINELLVRLTGRGDGDAALYRLYADTIGALTTDAALEPLLRRFEVGLLELSGYGVDFTITADTGRPIEAEGQYFFQPEVGFVVDYPSGATPALAGRTLLALAGLCAFDEPALREAKRFMRGLLLRQLGERPLLSRALFGGGG